MSGPTIVTLTRTWRYVERLTWALQSEFGSSWFDGDNLLIDNGLNPAEADACSAHGWQVIQPGWNTSFSEGNNIGADRARTPHLLLLNDDLIPEIGFVERLMARRGHFDVLGALLLHRDGTVNHAGVRVWPSCRSDHLGRHDPREKWEAPREIATPSTTFAAVLIDAGLWRQLGGLCEDYVYGWEDLDFCTRAIALGARVGVAHDAVAVHDECGTRPRNGDRDLQNFQLFYSRWSSWLPEVLRQYRQRERGFDLRGVEQ